MDPRRFDSLSRSFATATTRRGLLAAAGAFLVSVRAASTQSACLPGQTRNRKGDCSCPAGTDPCPTGCFDLKRDTANCGTCGRGCLGGECRKGECRCAPGLRYCSAQGSCAVPDGGECAGNEACCSGTCVGGVCVARSELGEACDTGDSADCATGLTCCNGTCRNTSTDAANCGGCDTVCPAGSATNCQGAGVCRDGACDFAPATAETTCRAKASPCDIAETCDGITTACPANAGIADGETGDCTGGQVCQSGSCVTPCPAVGSICDPEDEDSCCAGLTCCGGLCVDPTSDASHCSGCFRSCPSGPVPNTCIAGFVCSGSTCQPTPLPRESECGTSPQVCATLILLCDGVGTTCNGPLVREECYPDGTQGACPEGFVCDGDCDCRLA